MEPIARRVFPDNRGEKFEATQTIFDCGNGLGLSVVNAKKGDRWEHGWYCGPDTYEVIPITLDPADPWNFDFVCEDGSVWTFARAKESNYEIRMVDPKGWLSIEQLGQIAERLSKEGIKGW